jgi:CRP-like cAMP-binding protein
MELVSVAAGEAIFREGDNSCDVYLVRSGAVTINLNINGQERQFKSVTTGSLVGEINVATKGKRSATARAIADCRLAKLDGERYQRLYQKSEPLQALLKQRIARQVRETGEFIRQLNIIDGGDTCELLLREIWSEPESD